MSLRKSFNLEGIPQLTLNNLDRVDLAMSIRTRGIQGTNLIEPLPTYNRRAGDNIIEGSNNASIVLGRDRPGEIGSGHGSTTEAGTIDLVAGRVSSQIQTSILNLEDSRRDLLRIDPNLALDASRIYVSQKTDIDRNFNISEGTVGMSNARGGIGIKSDAVRVIGREGVKIVTKIDTHNSRGGGIISVPGIDLIAGNDESILEGVAKGDSLMNVLRDILQRISDLNQVLDSFMTSQIEFNTSVMTHEHPSPLQITIGTMASGNPMAINNGKIPFSPDLLQSGIKTGFMQQVSKTDGVQNNLQCTMTSMSATEIHGIDNPVSTNIKVT